MGVFNPRVKERFFRSIQSMIVQSFSAWELLLYDDGSSEPYATAIRSAADLDSRWEAMQNLWIHKENGGF